MIIHTDAVKNFPKYYPGHIVAFILILLASVMGLAAAAFSLVGYQIAMVGIEVNNERALQLAEAGANRALHELNLNSVWTGVGETMLGAGSYEVLVTGFGNSRTVQSTGFVPSRSNPIARRTIRMMISDSPGADSFRYGVQSGAGGMDLNSHSRVHGSAFSNGNITCDAHSSITGDGNTVGTVSPAGCVQGVLRQGVAPQPLPAFDAGYWQRAANQNPSPGCPTTGSLSFSNGTTTLGPCQVNGSLTLNSHAHLILAGPVYITGNFSMNSHSQLSIVEGFGADGTVLLARGTIEINSHSRVNRRTGGGHIMLVSSSTSVSAIVLNSHARGGVFYALNGTVVVNSHSHPVALTGQRIVLNSHAEIFYDQGLPDQSFTSGPGGGWVIRRGTWRIIPQ